MRQTGCAKLNSGLMAIGGRISVYLLYGQVLDALGRLDEGLETKLRALATLVYPHLS